MTERVIPILRNTRPRVLQMPTLPAPGGISLSSLPPVIVDARARALTDLRISVTDRCNFRCRYCMPREAFNAHHPYLQHADLLRFEEITRLARLFMRLGVRKIRLTGGEPLLRKDIESLIAQLAALQTPAGAPPDLTLTTNGALLARKAHALRDAGLQRVTVSLDALDDALFRRISDADFPVAGVLAGIDAARAAGLSPVKINMVIQRGVNDHQILPMARHFRGSGTVLRFIEFMDVGATNGWRMDQVVPSREVLARLQSEFALVPLPRAAPGETAERWGYAGADGRHDPALGEVGFISSVTRAFCGACSRARLSIDGRLYLCLFADAGYDLRAPLRAGADDPSLAAAIAAVWQGRADRYSELRASLNAVPAAAAHRAEMSYLGG